MRDTTNALTPTAIIAGNGVLPLEIARHLADCGAAPLLIGIDGEVDSSIEAFDHRVLGWQQIGSVFKVLRDRGVTRVAFAGGVSARPAFRLSEMDFATMLTLPRILGEMLGGDGALLSKVVSIFEGRGFEVVGAHDLAPHLVVGEGANGRHKLPKAVAAGLDVGRQLLGDLSSHDVGQACIVAGRRVVAVEGAEGTAGLLARTADMRAAGVLNEAYPALLVKAMKAGQDPRVDMPSIGPDTISAAQAAGLVAIAVEAGRTLVLRRDDTIRNADAAGLALHGF